MGWLRRLRCVREPGSERANRLAGLALVCILPMMAAHGRSPATFADTFHSPTGQYKAVIASPPQGGYKEPASVTLHGPTGESLEYPLFRGFPNTVHVLDDGRLVTVGRRGYGWPESAPDEHLQLITVVDDVGDVVFSADLYDLRQLAGPIKFPRTADAAPFWYHDASIVGGSRAYLKVVLAGYDEFHLSLDSLELRYVPVPLARLQERPEELRARARAYLHTRRPEGLSIFESLLDRFPGDLEAAYYLSRHAQDQGDYAKSIAILRPVTEHNPLSFAESYRSCNAISGFGIRCELIRSYLLAGEPQRAIVVVDAIREYARPHAEFDLLEIETLLALGRFGDADAIVNRLVSRKRQDILFRSHVSDLVWLYERWNLDGLIDALFEKVAGSRVEAEIFEDRVSYLIRKGRESAAVPLLDKLMDGERRTWAANKRGELLADDRGDIPMDLEAARRWFETAAVAPDAQLHESRYALESAHRHLCHISLAMRREYGLDDAAKWCGGSAFDRMGGRWSAIVFLDPSYANRNVDKGLRILESSPCDGQAHDWADGRTFYRPEYAEDVNAWAESTLALNSASGNAELQYCLGSMYVGRYFHEGGPNWLWNEGFALLSKAAGQDHVDALLDVADLRKLAPCDANCWAEVRLGYRRAAELGEKMGYYELASVILNHGPDDELETAERYLQLFSEMSSQEDLDPEYFCGKPSWIGGPNHGAEELYSRLEERMGRAVERIPDRACPTLRL